MEENTRTGIPCPLSTCLTVQHPTFPEDACPALKSHEFTEIALVERGGGIHRLPHQSLPCKKGDIYILPPNLPHGFFVSHEGEELSVRHLFFRLEDWLEGDVLSPDSPHYCFGVFREGGISYALLNDRTYRQVKHLFSAIEEECTLRDTDWKQATGAHLTLLLITLERFVGSAIRTTTPTFNPKEWPVISAALHLIDERFAESDLTLDRLAGELLISTSQLSRLIQRYTGKPFSSHLRRTRLNHACRLLEDTEYQVEQIVAMCGLRDIPGFYRNFHEYTDMTPHQYRIHYHIKNNTKQGERIMSILKEISESLQKGKHRDVPVLVQKALDEGCAPADILNEGLLDGMNVIGTKFREGTVFVPEVLVAARAMKMGTNVLQPHLVAAGVKANGKVCIGTVQGDLHDIGKNLVKMMMEGKGLEVIDLGTDVSPEAFINAAKEQGCQVICCSALLTTTMNVMAEVVKAAEAAGIRDSVKIMIGGAPVTEEFCNQIGADCYTNDAASAANAAVEFCK